MRREVLHSGLAALLVLAPALCCCNVRWLTGHAVASSVPTPACPSCPEPAPVPTPPSCCRTATPVTPSCCHEVEEPAAPGAAPDHSPPTPCKCYGERPDATAPESAPAVAAPEPTSGLLPLEFLGVVGVPTEHLGFVGGLDPPERAGVDTRSAALFDRHVLRC